MKKLTVYNTLSGKKEEFSPLNEGNVNMYVCGITPYAHAHLGHARCYIVFDVLKRVLEFKGYSVSYVQNITDIDDKIINKSQKTGKSPSQISNKYFKEFKNNMKLLNVRPASRYPKVSENIDQIIEFVKGLLERDMAYEKNGNVYYRVSEFAGYGKLSGRKPDELISEENKHSSEKEDARDFALWKKDEQFGWESPWGKGRPGWHIECSAMSKKYLGDTFDIHGGGLDLIFPHHENEIAQSEGLTGKDPAKYWIHNGMVNLKGDKMAKSTGNFFLLKEILNKYPPMVLRMFLLSSSYRQDIDFSIKELSDTQKAYSKLVEFKKEINELLSDSIKAEDLESFEHPALRALDNDFNTARAIGEIFKTVNSIMEKIFQGTQQKQDIIRGGKLVRIFEKVLGIELFQKDNKNISEEEIRELVKEREEYRENKQFKKADKIREKLKEAGVVLKDTPTGTRWNIKNE
ncbi:MAG: cysteine--tRNA ligase [Elusimicrobiota bacterium]